MIPFEARVAEALLHLAATGPEMRDLIAAVGRCELSPAWRRSPFESLVRAVAHQQLQGKAAEAILGRFLALFEPRDFPSPGEILAMEDTVLRAVGFSRSKILAIRDIAAKAADGIVPTREQAEALSDAELISRLLPLRGVGQWTVEMLLIFSLGRLDVFPLDDFGVRKGMKVAFRLEEMPSKREMLAISECWRPYRSIGAWYLWRLAATQPRPSRLVAKTRADDGSLANEEGELQRRDKSRDVLA